jgi:endonuclease YncB( thermonuclease family)
VLGAKTTFSGAVLFAAILAAGPVRSEGVVMEGRARVIDGMTLEIWGKRVRLSGISGPAAETPGGRRAKRYLETLVGDVMVRCEMAAGEFRATTPGTCAVGAVDLSESLVRAGHARSLVQQSSGH